MSDRHRTEGTETTARSALASLLAEYGSCFSPSSSSTAAARDDEGRGKSEGRTEGSSSPAKPASSPWSVARALASVLGRVDLLDPNFLDSRECRELEIGLSRALKSANRVKWEVMNRNDDDVDDGVGASLMNGRGGAEVGEGGITSLGGKDGRLLRSIQVQVWMRMMAWSLERDAGWEFLGRAIALSDAEWREAEAAANVTTAAAAAAARTNKKGKNLRKKKDARNDRGLQAKERKPARDGLVEDVRQLTELAPYILPVSIDFSHWLKHTLTFGFRQRIPDYGAELFDHFEIEVAEQTTSKPADADASRLPDEFEASNSAVGGNCTTGNMIAVDREGPAKQLTERRHNRQRAYFASLVDGERMSSNNSNAAADDETATNTGSSSTATSTSKSSSVREIDDAILFKTPVSLTAAARAQTSNPFLKGSARGSYVGSHLGSKLSNITSLFREVKAPIARLNPAKTLVADRKGVNLPTSLATTAHKKRKSDGGAQARVTSSSPLKETPLKRHRPSFASSRPCAAPTFTVVETPSRPIIEETPAKRQTATARLRLPIIEETPAKRQTFTARLPYAGNSIVAETPQQRQPMRSDRPHVENPVVAETPQHRQPKRGDGPVTSSALPTNLWRWQDVHRPPLPPPPRHSFLLPNHPSRGRWRPHSQESYIEKNSGNEHLSPIVHQFSIGSSAQLRFGLSPLPNQEDMDEVMAKVAKSAASKKKK